MNWNNLTPVLAAYGALVSTITAAWNIWNGLKDRPRLQLTLTFGKILRGTQGAGDYLQKVEDPTGAALWLTICNTGRRPVTVRTWGGTYKKPAAANQGFLVVTRGLPVTLKEGEAHEEYTTDFSSLLSQGVKAMYVFDAGDRRWQVPKSELKRITHQYERANPPATIAAEKGDP